MIQTNWKYGPEAFWDAFRQAIRAGSVPAFLAPLDKDDSILVSESEAKEALAFLSTLPEFSDSDGNEALDFIEQDNF